MDYNKSVEIHQSSQDVKRSMSSRSSADELDRKSGVPETTIHGVRAETVSTANTAQSVHGGMGNTYNYFLIGRREEVITEMIDQLGIGTQIDNNVLKSAQDTFTSERKSRVRLDSESEKQVMVEDHSQQHSHQAITEVATDSAIEAATDATTEVATDATTEVATDTTTDDATDHAIESGNGGQYSDNIKPSLVSALYHSMGIFFRGRNASQLKECLPGLEIREPDINLQSKGLSVSICNAEGESENTKDCVEADWVMVSEEDGVCSTCIVHNEVIPRASSDSDYSIPHKVRISQPTTTRQSQGLDIENNENTEMPFDAGGIYSDTGGIYSDTGGRYRNGGTGSSTLALGMYPDKQEIRLGNQAKECTTPHENRHFQKGEGSNITRDATNGGGWPQSMQGTEMQYKTLLEQWKQIDQRPSHC